MRPFDADSEFLRISQPNSQKTYQPSDEQRAGFENMFPVRSCICGAEYDCRTQTSKCPHDPKETR